MDDEQENKTCGCDCENCASDNHPACTSGMCKYKAPDETPEDTNEQ